MASKGKILLVEGIHPVAVENLKEAGYEVTCRKDSPPRAELDELLPEHIAIGIRSKTRLTTSLLHQHSHLQVVGAFCIGTNQIDLETSGELGIPVFNAPYSNTRSVAEMVIAEVVMLARYLGDRNRECHQGQWQKVAKGAHEIRGKTLGIVGYGHIGSQVSILAEAMGMRVLYYDILKKLPLGNARQLTSLQELLALSDYVTLHVPGTPETKEMIGEEQIAAMKSGACLINASRGDVVVIPALASALKAERIRGAAIDVFPKEPRSNEEPFVSELQTLPNVILSPHIGGSTEEAQENIGREVSDALIRYLQNGSSVGAVNLPVVEPPQIRGADRIVNIHRNVPGVLGEINKIVSDVGANISWQQLATNAKIGYMVMDTEQHLSDAVSERIGRLPTSIKTKVLSRP